VLIVGIDPHKQSHTAAALDSSTGEFLGEKTIPSTAKGYRDLLAWLERMTVDLVAVENVRGLGQNLAAWLAGRGYAIVDVTTKEVRAQRLARRGGRNKNDTTDALAAALTAATGSGYRYAHHEQGHLADLLTEEREGLNGEYTAKRNRLHAHLRILRPGGAPVGASLAEFADLLKGVKATSVVVSEVKRLARELLADLRRLKTALERNRERMRDLAEQTRTSLTAIPGIAEVAAMTILGAIGDISRFASHHHLAAFTGAAPRQIASGNADRHRLDRHGNNRIRRAIHVAAMTQARMKTGPGRIYYLRKRDEGKTHREALRCLKRQLIKAIWRAMTKDQEQQQTTPALAA
jgi:transposase